MTVLGRGSERWIDLCLIRRAFLFQLLTQHLARLQAVVVLRLDNENGRAGLAYRSLQPVSQHGIPALRCRREGKKGLDPKSLFRGQEGLSRSEERRVGKE